MWPLFLIGSVASIDAVEFKPIVILIQIPHFLGVQETFPFLFSNII